MNASLDERYFERLYSQSDDPWNFATDAYELGKYRETLALLGGPYRRGLEIGCSIGILTEMLAPRFEQLLAVDINARAIAQAKANCAGRPNVRFERMTVPRDFPLGPFDAVVLSEVGYYWSDADLALAMDRIAESATGGVLELVHFRPKVEDYVRDGDAVHQAFMSDGRFVPTLDYRADRYRIDVLLVR
jgi:SAM-dependent methyltransferase